MQRDESGKFRGKEKDEAKDEERAPVAVDPFDPAQRGQREPEPEPEPEPEAEPVEREPEKPTDAAEPVETAEAEGAPDSEPESAEKHGESAHEKGLRKEIERLRREKREWEERWQSLESLGRLRDAGIGTAPQQTTQAGQAGQGAQIQPDSLPPRLEVEFDPATGKAYIPADRLYSLVEERRRPDPFVLELQRRAQVEQQLRADFVGQDPRRNELYARAEQAKRMAEEIAVGAARRRGISSAQLGGPDQIVAFIRDTGALDEVGEKFPDIGPQALEDMMYAAAVGSPRLLRRALDAYAASALKAGTTAPADHRADTEPELRELPPEKPRSMAQRGAPDRKGAGSKDSRFRELEERFSADQFSLSRAEYQEYARLLSERERAA